MNEKLARHCNKSVVNAERTNRLSAAYDKSHRSSRRVSLLNWLCVGSEHEKENEGKRIATSYITFCNCTKLSFMLKSV